MKSERGPRKPHVEICPTPADVARAAAQRITDQLVLAAAKSERVSMALSGGNGPRELYRLLSDPRGAFRARIPWGKLDLFLVDERYVPPGDPQSNFRMIEETLLEDKLLPKEQLHPVRTHIAPPELAAADYQGEIERYFKADSPGRIPVFNVVLLGLGANAHTASLFPDVPPDHAPGEWVKAFHIPSLGAYRVSLLPDLINAAELVLLAAAGAEKAEAVAHVLSDEENTSLWPAQLISPAKGKYLWIIDEAAARVYSTRK